MLRDKLEKHSSAAPSNESTSSNTQQPAGTNPPSSQPSTDNITTQFHTGGSSTISSSCGGDSIRSSTDNLVSGGEENTQTNLQATAQASTTETVSTSAQSAEFVDKLLSKQTDHVSADAAEKVNGDVNTQQIQDLQQKLKETLQMLKKEKRYW